MKAGSPRVLTIAMTMALAGCSNERSAGGSAETENAASARLLRVDSLLPEWNRPTSGSTVATLRLDANNFTFDISDPSGLGLDVRKVDGTPLPFAIESWEPKGKSGRLHVRIDPDLLAPDSRIALWSRLSHLNRTDSDRLWRGIPDSQKTELISVLVDDFEGASLRTRLPNGSTWFTLSGTGTGIATADRSRAGHALRVVSTSTSSSPVALAAALLADTPRSLAGVDSIVFWARGRGTFLTSLQRADQRGMVVAWTSRTLDSSWQRYRVLPGEFDTTTRDSNVSWSEVRDSVSHLSYWMVGPGEIWMDDPRLFGIDRDDLR